MHSLRHKAAGKVKNLKDLLIFMIEVSLIISGRVQGVFYRESAKKEAQKQDISGWVKNKSDGTVEVLAQGEEEKINQFIEWCKIGPSLADVAEVKIADKKEISSVSESGFRVEY